MKTPSNSAVTTLLNSGRPFFRADLYTFVLDDTTVLRYADFDQDVTVNDHTYSASGPIFVRTKTVQQRGLEVDEMQLTITPREGNQINGVDFMKAVVAGTFDGADFTHEFAVFDPDVSLKTPIGTINWFGGRVSYIPDGARLCVDMTIQSDLERLDIDMPRNMYQPGCLNTLFDAACLVSREAFKLENTIESVVSAQKFTVAIKSSPAGWFDQGTIVITSGLNTSVKRTVKSWTAGGVVELFLPFRYLPVAGQTCQMFPGCNKTREMCSDKFNNLLNFRGYPLIPIADSVI